MKYAILAVLIAGVLLFVACSANVQHDVNRANKQFSDDLSEAEQNATSLFKSGEIDRDDYTTIETFVVEATDDHKTLTSQLRSLPDLKGANLAKALTWTQAFVDKIHGYNLHLKSAKAQQVASAFFASFDALMNTVIASLQKQAALIVRGPVMRADGELPAYITIILGIYASIAKLIGQWKADGTLTDQQLQDAADAEDDETKKRALANLKELGK